MGGGWVALSWCYCFWWEEALLDTTAAACGGSGSGWCGTLLVRVVDFGFVLLLWTWIFVVVAA